jgi:hypothetical protein
VLSLSTIFQPYLDYHIYLEILNNHKELMGETPELGKFMSKNLKTWVLVTGLEPTSLVLGLWSELSNLSQFQIYSLWFDLIPRSTTLKSSILTITSPIRLRTKWWRLRYLKLIEKVKTTNITLISTWAYNLFLLYFSIFGIYCFSAHLVLSTNHTLTHFILV